MSWKTFFKKQNKRIYLDHAAATPLRPEVFEVMHPWFVEHAGNPSAVHKEGVLAHDAIETARESLARILHTRASEITYTSGGTESNNLAIKGVVDALCSEGKKLGDIEILTTKIEHPSVLRTLEKLVRDGVSVRYVDVEEDGRISEQSVRELLNVKTSLVTFAYANSEVGIVQDVKRITRIVRKWNAEHDARILVHLDASQAPLWLPCQMDRLGVDLMTLDGGKCGGPMGSGVLVRRRGVHISPVVFGGGQEDGLRAGTENTPLVIGCSKAIEIAQATYVKRSEAVASLRDTFIGLLEEKIPGVIFNGSRSHRIANNVNISLPGFDSEFAVVVLDRHGIAASTKSACGGVDGDGSHVVRALTGDVQRANSTVRFTLGEEIIEKDLACVVDVLKEHTDLMRHI